MPMRILYLHGSVMPPPNDLSLNKFAWLSEQLEGDVLQQVWFSSPGELEETVGPGSYPIHLVRRFRYHFLLMKSRNRLINKMALACFFISEGLKVYRDQGFECIVTYAHTLTALCGVVLKWLTGAKLIVEIVTQPDKAYVVQNPTPRPLDCLMQLYSNICVHLSLWSCDRAHLLAPTLLAGYKRLQNVRASAFFQGVPVSQIPRHHEASEQYILLVGAPANVKGVDLLIAAFKRLAADFPDVKLKLLGYYPDRQRLEEMADGISQIEFLGPRPHPEVLGIMSNATIFALPSRNEGVATVVIEAMSSGVPLVVSDAGGLPTVVRDGENGFLVPVGNVDMLELRLRQLLSDPELRRRIGSSAYETARKLYSEPMYVRQFSQMIRETVGAAAKDPGEGRDRPAGAKHREVEGSAR
ncbi:MAG TPA: glycosyltransferase family 4 protein [Bryobacteraceae bacterium]|nr:glycosyltransferase family 4 protein [Bryobacteraceae bacterium]